MNLPPLLDRATQSLRRLLPAGRTDAVVAVDVGARTVRAVHVRHEKDALVLDGYRVARVGDDPATLEAGCRSAMELRVSGEPVAVSLSSRDAAIRKVELPAMSFEELQQALPWEARRHIAGLAEDSIVDAQVLNAGGNGAPMEIVLVALPRAQYDRLAALWARLGVSPAFVDVGQLSTMNSFLGTVPPTEVTGVLDLGAEEAWFAAFSSSNLAIFRDISVRVEHLDTKLAERFGLAPAQLDAFKTSGRLPGGATPPAGKVEEALGDLIGELAEDLRSALVFLENRSGTSLERVHLTGANAAFLDRQGIAEAISAQSGVTLHRYNPFQGFRFGLIDEVTLKASSSELCPAAGAARRFFAAA